MCRRSRWATLHLIVHVGFALSKIDEDEAVRTLEVFRQMGVLDEELQSEDEAFARSIHGASRWLCPDGSCSSQ